MRTLIVGVKGQLGRELLARFKQEGETAGADLPELDIGDPDAVTRAVEAFGPDVVINAAAFTDVEAAEDRAEAAYRVNETGARNVAAAANEVGVPVFYYSTDYVFDGAKGAPYEPTDPPNPLCVYARSKLAGEQATREANPRAIIIRTAWLYGPGGNNFVEKILRAAAARPVLSVVEDEIGSPTYTRDLAEATARLCRAGARGTFHAVNTGGCSRFEFAKAILSAAGSATELKPVPATQFPTKARRPLYSILSNALLQRETGFVMPCWEDALRDYMKRRDA